MFSKVYIVDSIKWWDGIDFDFNKDLCLTFDFALFEYIKKNGGDVFYIDHLIDKDIMQSHNFQFYDFFKRWHYNLKGKDIFTYRSVEFGFSLRLEIWNDLTYYLRLRYCLSELLDIRFQNLVVGTEVKQIFTILNKLGLNYTLLNFKANRTTNFETYYFPIYQWLDEKVRYKGINGFKYIIRGYLGTMQALFVSLFDRLFVNKINKPLIFIQEYHPTKKIISEISKNSHLRVLLATFSRSPGFFRFIPLYKREAKFNKISNELLTKFLSQRHEKYLFNNEDISEELYDIIENRISPCLANYVKNLDCIIDYLNSENLKLIVLITNMGKIPTLIDCVGKYLGIPNYLIINGFMSGDFVDESKYANYINSYSISIRDNFFKNMDNIFVLGDPRMDVYSKISAKSINRNNPTITIGSSGHSTMDLNSFVAVEFEFLYQVLDAIGKCQKSDKSINILIKVRPNGYIQQYHNFVNKYFQHMKVTIVGGGTMLKIFKKTDLYISIGSQTLIEASCLGIPVIYHKNDAEKIDPPFDNNSELVTTTTTRELLTAVNDFFNKSDRFDKFLDKKVLEKYIGPLDGGNLKRNIDFIYQLINKNGHT